MAILLYLKHPEENIDFSEFLNNNSENTVYLAGRVPTNSIIENVSNNKINFPAIPPHIVKENSEREKLLCQLNKIATQIESTWHNFKVVPTLVDSDLSNLIPFIESNDLHIKKVIKIN